MSAAELTFLPYLRTGVSAAIGAAPAGESPHRAKVTARVAITGADKPVERDVRIMGPGDVVGIDPAEIVRVEPPDGTTAHEPHRLPAIEFRRPALPWLFSPTAPTDERLRPWCTLVVLEERKGVALVPGPRPASQVLRVEPPVHAGTELGDPALATVCAHVQVSGPVTPETLAGVIASEPERVLSRVIYPHGLGDQRRYLACLVPTSMAGRRAGLGERVGPDDPAGDAWRTTDAIVELPVYHHWRFATGEGGDFRSLASRLRPRRTPADVGRYRLDVSGLLAGATLTASGALRAPGGADEPAPRAVRRMLTVAPPYAAAHAGSRTPGADSPGWFAELNLDPRHRVAAGIGARIVREVQEALVAAAWAQAAGGAEANRLVEQLSLADAAGRRLHDAIAPLAPEALDAVAAPALRRMRTAPVGEDTPTARARLLEALDPQRTVRARLDTRLRRPADDRAAQLSPGLVAADTGAAADAPDTLARLLVSPTFLTAMWERTAQLAPEHMLPSASLLEAETVSLLETNGAFVAALLAGLNDELARELVWRDFPLDRRSTFFRHFWGAPGGDIPPIEEWDANAALEDVGSAQAGRLVLAVRGELLRRYPGTLLYAVPAVLADGRPTPGPAPEAVRQPLFRGSVPPDIRYFGFALTAAEARSGAHGPGWYFVLQQQAIEARLELPRDGQLPLTETAARVAQKALQPAARVAIHADDLLPEAGS